MSVFTTNTGKSRCCKSEVIVWTGDESTSHYECLKCGKDCDVIFNSQDPKEEINAKEDKTYEDGLLEGRICKQSEIDYHIEKERETFNRILKEKKEHYELKEKLIIDEVKKDTIEEIKQNIGILRQYCNELPEGTLLTNQLIEYILMGEKLL